MIYYSQDFTNKSAPPAFYGKFTVPLRKDQQANTFVENTIQIGNRYVTTRHKAVYIKSGETLCTQLNEKGEFSMFHFNIVFVQLVNVGRSKWSPKYERRLLTVPCIWIKGDHPSSEVIDPYAKVKKGLESRKAAIERAQRKARYGR